MPRSHTNDWLEIPVEGDGEPTGGERVDELIPHALAPDPTAR
ncbi:MAG: hypothetical protein ACM3SX_13120 [Deltaproteobacteria bacterium]